MRAEALGLGLGLGLGPTANGSALGRSEPERAAHNRVVGFAVRRGALGALGALGAGRPPILTPPP